MKKITFILALILVCSHILLAQNPNENKKPRIALILSGGGAKGIAHIPVLQMLDSLGIVPDLVVGNSMGSIVGGLYAMGYSPDEMETLIGSEEFKRWYSGQVEEGYVYYFKKTADEDQFDAMVKQIKESLGEHDQILLKGSNSMNLAKVVEELQAKN